MLAELGCVCLGRRGRGRAGFRTDEAFECAWPLAQRVSTDQDLGQYRGNGAGRLQLRPRRVETQHAELEPTTRVSARSAARAQHRQRARQLVLASVLICSVAGCGVFSLKRLVVHLTEAVVVQLSSR